MKLIIGNQNYSSWSLRPWLLLTAFGIEFEQQVVSLRDEGMKQRLGAFSAAAKVPVLQVGELSVWDTLAICEYVSEQYLDGKGWPQNVNARAMARALTAEMHSGFQNIRNELPMNIRATRKLEISAAAQAEIAHIDDIWSGASGDYLFEDYGVVDCFFTPIASRFKTYGVKLSPSAQAYAAHLLGHNAMQKWTQQALLENEFLAEDEAGDAV